MLGACVWRRCQRRASLARFRRAEAAAFRILKASIRCSSGGVPRGSLKAFEAGGLGGVGPGAGTIKYRLPDAHTDFIFAVAGEEFGIALCILIALLFGVVTIRLLLRAARSRDPFAQLAASGLALVVG